MDSLHDLLMDKNFDEPAEAAAIKRYVRQHFKTAVEVTVRERDILVRVPSASLASTLRFRTQPLRREAQTTKRLIFRVG